MTYFAAAVVRGAGGWSGSEIDLDGAGDLEEVADRLREIDPDAHLALLLVEVEDEFLAIMRVDDGDEARVFVSDAGFAAETKVGEVLIADLDPVRPPGFTDDTDIEPGADPGESAEDESLDHEVEDDLTGGVETDGDPVGDPDLLADLGTPTKDLLAMCAHEGTMPADVLVTVCARAGCGDVLEELREA